MAKRRILIVVNKWWECDPVVNVLLNDNARPYKELGWPHPLNHPRRRPDPNNLPPENSSPAPRAIFDLNNTSTELWCISDLLEHYPDRPQFQSSSEIKARHLPNIFRGSPADLVIAAGTAAYPDANSENGSVVIGSKVFMHNAHPKGENPDSNWQGGQFDELLSSSIDPAVFAVITDIETAPTPSVMKRFMNPPLNPASDARLISRHDNVSLGTINVTDSAEFAKADNETIKAFTAKYDPSTAKSVDTTHGLIRSQSDAPFIFISGIPNRVGHFGDEVAPRLYSQNTSAAHNAGIVLAWMLPKIDAAFS